MNLTKQTEPAPTARREVYVAPRCDIVGTPDGYEILAEMPGVAAKGLEVTVENGLLTIVGRRTETERPGELVYRESREVDFRRSFELEGGIDTGRITARMENGVLHLALPKAEAVKPRRIEVK